MSDSAPATHDVLHRSEQVDPQRRSSVFMGSDRLLSQQFAQLVFCLQVGQRCRWRRSAKSAYLRCVWWLDEFCGVEILYARFYGFEKVAALERATCLEPDGIVLRLSAD